MTNPAQQLAEWVIEHPAVSEALDVVALSRQFQVNVVLLDGQEVTAEPPFVVGDVLVGTLDDPPSPIAVIHENGEVESFE